MKQRSAVFEYPLVIREHHIDTFGHVNNATYLQILEEARWELITQNGYGMKEVAERQIGPVILDLTIKFKKELRLRKKVIIKTFCSEYASMTGKITHIIENEKGEIACEAVLTFGLFDLRQRKLISPTTEWIKAIGME